MDFPLALNKVKEKQENIKTCFSKAEKVYQNKQKELQQKREELGSCESTAASSHTHLKQMTQLYQNQKICSVLKKRNSLNVTTWKKYK